MMKRDCSEPRGSGFEFKLPVRQQVISQRGHTKSGAESGLDRPETGIQAGTLRLVRQCGKYMLQGLMG